MKLEFCRQIFEKYSNIVKKCFQWEPSCFMLKTDGQTDTKKPIAAFRNFGNGIKNSTFCPHSVFMCFVWISEQTAIISLCNINWLVFITETECVYCAVRTGCFVKPSEGITRYQFAVLSKRSCLPTVTFHCIKTQRPTTNSTDINTKYAC
jgi:hypothetical protein